MAVRVGPELDGVAVLQHVAAVEHQDLVEAFDSRQPVGDDDCRPVLEKAIDGVRHSSLGFRVDTRRCFVEQHEVRRAQEQTGQGDQLTLAAGQPGTSRPELGVQPLRHRVDPVEQSEF